MDKMTEPPDGIIICVGAKELKEKGKRHSYRDEIGLPRPVKELIRIGYKVWLNDFLDAMQKEDWTYWYKMGNRPTVSDMLYVYICIGNQIRWRANFVMSEGPKEMEFSSGRKMYGRAWIVCAGPAVKAPTKIERKGFQGFRYTQKLF